MNKKQRQTKRFDQKADLRESIDENMVTLVSFNKGGKWQKIRAPEKDSDGHSTKCLEEDGCHLHLQIYSSGTMPPIYSQESAVGIVMGVGNVGKRLDMRHLEKQNVYLSRDGGLNWAEVKKGPHIYEIGDHGALIVMAPINKATKEIIFTWDEGKTWKNIEISDVPFLVENIIIEPNSISQQFVLHGVYADEDHEEQQGALITIDFSNLHEP